VTVPSPAAADQNQPAVPDREAGILASEPRNLLTLAIYMVTLRFAWIFKTESVLMPRFLDIIGGSAFLRGWLPILNRAGQSLPPLLLADWLRRQPLKKTSLRRTSTLMGLCFLLLAAAWMQQGEPVDGNSPAWMPVAFLILYTVFFVANGLNQLALGTLQGKLIRADRRGRLLAWGGIVGSIISVALAWFLLQKWLEPPLRLPSGGYVLIFGFAGTGFALAGLLTLPVREPIDHRDDRPHASAMDSIREAWQVLRDDRSFRGAAIVAMLFMSMQLLFPHFQAYGRQGLPPEDEGFHLMLWVIAQNGAVGVFSWLFGTIADRRGNRLAIRWQVFLCTLTPLIALFLMSGWVPDGARWFWVAFLFLGLVPVSMKSFINYVLELSDTPSHPRYVSTMSLCFAVPFVLSPGIGALIDVMGFEPVFLVVSFTSALGGLLTFRMAEPRHAPPPPAEVQPPDLPGPED